MKYFAYIGCSILTTEICNALPRVDSLIDLRFIPAGFHEQPQVMQKMIQAEIDRTEDWNEARKQSTAVLNTLDGILLGFGLCDQATVGLTSRTLPLVLPRAHDCITLLLGSKERYRQNFTANSGNYWYSCGWIDRMIQPGPEREKKLSEAYEAKYGAENAEFLVAQELEWQKKYDQATFINSAPESAAKYRRYTQDCAAYLGWRYAEMDGDPTLIVDFLKGNWDEDRFLIVRPGEEIAPSYDERVATCKKCL